MFRELRPKKMTVPIAMGTTWTPLCPQRAMGHPCQPCQVSQAHNAPPSLPGTRKAQPSDAKLTAMLLRWMNELGRKANPCSRWPPTVFPQQCFGLSPAQPLLIHPLTQRQPCSIPAVPAFIPQPARGAPYNCSALPSTGTHVP